MLAGLQNSPVLRLTFAMLFKPYLKLYLSLLGLILVVITLCYSVTLGLNNVRERAYLESLAWPLLSWLAAHPDISDLDNDSDLPGEWQALAPENAALGPVETARLSYGQVLAEERGDGVRWLYRMNNGAIVQLVVEEPYRDIAEIRAKLLAGLVEADLMEPDEASLMAVGHRLGLMAETVTRAEQFPGQPVLDQLGEGRLAYFQPDEGDPAQVFVRLEGGEYAGRVLRLTMRPPFDPWAWPVLLLVLAIVAATVAALAHLVLSRLHHQLASIENVVARIARGELEARVREGSQPVIGRLGGAFNSMADHIQRLVGVQREMIHAVSHELRTPVARIRFGVQMLEDNDDRDDRNHQLAAIDGDIQELDELIDEILTYARLEQGGPVIALQEINTCDIVRRVVAEQQTVHPGLTISAIISPASEKYALSDADPRYLHRAIQNLVGNATRYARSEVRVVCQLETETCRVDVEDDGAGIPENDWDKVFTAFARLDDSRTRKSGGYGLGLSIVRRVLFWHGGQAFVGRSEELGGARFSLVWPRRQVDSATTI